MSFNASDLEGYLKYELCAAERYRRFVSLMAIKPEKSFGSLQEYLASEMRTCDCQFEFDGDRFILMAETSASEAQVAAKRYQAALCSINAKAKLHYGIAAYPGDGKTPRRLIAAARKQLQLTGAEEE